MRLLLAAVLAIQGCDQDCVGVGCLERFSAASADLHLGSELPRSGTHSPTEATGAIQGTTTLGADWDVSVVRDKLIIGSRLADLDADGTVEVVLGKVIVNGEDGTLQGEGFNGDASYGGAYFDLGQIPAIGDIDGDGQQEVLAGNSIYDADGNQLCSLMEPTKDGFTAIGDLDMDGDGEIVMVWDHKITIINEHCHETAEWPMVGEGTGGPPTIADFDGDGEPEIGVASALDYCVYEPTGALLWAFGTTDESSHATGSTVFDFEGDGRPEVVYGDEVKLWILDGPSGAVRFESSLHSWLLARPYL